MSAKKHLREIAILDRRIENRKKELEKLRDEILSPKPIRYDADLVKSGTPSDTMADAVAMYVDMEHEIDALIETLVTKRHKIVGEIERLEDPRYIQLLMLRYVEMKTFEEIACEMNYSYRQTTRLHGYALQAFDRCVLSCPTMTYKD